MSQPKKANNLIHAASPYLKQHAFNPVNWYPWGKEALQKARDEDKPMIISIGYSACHWCHVMEHESFENEEIAEVMNDGFICIKVDREERPDVDQIYMEAIQTMGINGGWPLNVFALPNQQPFYGGTYFRPKQWLHILHSIVSAYQEKTDQLIESAREFTKAISISDAEKYGIEDHGFSSSLEDLQQMANAMKDHFDRKEGGLKRAPKFPNPSIWKFLLSANYILRDDEIRDQVNSTLDNMANGGIYDQLGGGFARYAVDEHWFAPHFEKMLYDNGQLISLYAMAFQLTNNARYKEIITESIQFVKRELMSPEYGFYSALDADSEGEEGNYYIWDEEELDQLLGQDASLIKAFYNTDARGNWERGMNILHRVGSYQEFAANQNIALEKLNVILEDGKAKLLAARKNREQPGLDDKILTGWNGMMLKGLLDACQATGDQSFLELAEKNAVFIDENLMSDGALLRSFPGGSEKIPGYLDDYACVMDGFIVLFQVTFKQRYLDLAAQLLEYTLEQFYDSKEELFFYTSNDAEILIARKKELFDNVIPASNSVMAHNLFFLGHLTENQRYIDLARSMLSRIVPMIKTEPQYLTNWGTLYTYFTYPTIEIAIVGEHYREFAHELQQHFIPNKLMDGCAKSSNRPLLNNRTAIDGKTTIYVCFNKSCKLPVHSVNEALEQIKSTIFS